MPSLDEALAELVSVRLYASKFWESEIGTDQNAVLLLTREEVRQRNIARSRSPSSLTCEVLHIIPKKGIISEMPLEMRSDALILQDIISPDQGRLLFFSTFISILFIFDTLSFSTNVLLISATYTMLILILLMRLPFAALIAPKLGSIIEGKSCRRITRAKSFQALILKRILMVSFVFLIIDL